MASSSSYSNPPCAACKFLRRKCLPGGCVFSPYFPPEDPTKFVNVHKIFGASNVSKLLHDIPPHHREDAVNSLAYEAEARLKDPVYGCVGAISVLQGQVINLQKELDATNADILRFANNNNNNDDINSNNNYRGVNNLMGHDRNNSVSGLGRRVDYGAGCFDPSYGFSGQYGDWGWNIGGSSGEAGGDGSS